MDNVRKALPFSALFIPPFIAIADRTRFFGLFSQKAFEGAEEAPSLILNREVVVLWFQDMSEKATHKLGEAATQPLTIVIALMAVAFCVGHYRKEIQKAWNTISPWARIAALEAKLAEKTVVAPDESKAIQDLRAELRQLKEQKQSTQNQGAAQELAQLKDRWQNFETKQIEAFKDLNADLKNDLSRILSSVDQFSKDLLQQSQTTEALKTNYESLNGRLTKLEEIIATKAAASEIIAFSAELSSLKAMLEQVQQQNNQASKASVSQEEEKTKQLNRLQENLSQVEQKFASLNATVSSLNTTIDTKVKEQYSSLISQLSELKQTAAKLAPSSELELLRSQVNNINETIASMSKKEEKKSDLNPGIIHSAAMTDGLSSQPSRQSLSGKPDNLLASTSKLPAEKENLLNTPKQRSNSIPQTPKPSILTTIPTSQKKREFLKTEMDLDNNKT